MTLNNETFRRPPKKHVQNTCKTRVVNFERTEIVVESFVILSKVNLPTYIPTYLRTYIPT